MPLASSAARRHDGETLDEIGLHDEIIPPYVSVKEAVFPFNKFRGVGSDARPRDALDGRGHGNRRVVRHGVRQGAARADDGLPLEGAIFVTVNDSDKAQRRADRAAVSRRWASASSRRRAPPRYLRARGIPPSACSRCTRGGRTRRPDRERRGAAAHQHAARQASQQDDYTIRREALAHRIPYTTTMSAANAACDAILALRSRAGEVRSLQEWHALAREMSPEWTG